MPGSPPPSGSGTRPRPSPRLSPRTRRAGPCPAIREALRVRHDWEACGNVSAHTHRHCLARWTATRRRRWPGSPSSSATTTQGAPRPWGHPGSGARAGRRASGQQPSTDVTAETAISARIMWHQTSVASTCNDVRYTTCAVNIGIPGSAAAGPRSLAQAARRCPAYQRLLRDCWHAVR